MATDEQIKKDVTDQLFWDNRVDAGEVDVSVTNGRVTLSGSVPTYRALNAARNDAISVNGVTKVTNNLVVRYPGGLDMPSDTELQSNVEHALDVNPDLDASDVISTVEDGTVKLEGTVPSFWEKLEAEVTAGGIVGVIDVINNITVVPTEDLSDRMIADDVIASLDRNANIDADKIDVTVENGVVTLDGTVPTGYIRDVAYDTANYTSGVVGVVNNLIVSPLSVED